MRPGSANVSPSLMFLFGGIFALIGVFTGLSRASFAAGAEHARGEITSLETRSHGSGRRRSHSTYADVSFADAAGERHTFHTKIENGDWRVHEEIDVIYRPGLPGNARVGGFLNQWLMPLFFVVGGLGAIGVGWLRS